MVLRFGSGSETLVQRYAFLRRAEALYTHLAVLYNPPQLVDHFAVDEGLLPDHRVILVVGVVGIP